MANSMKGKYGVMTLHFISGGLYVALIGGSNEKSPLD